MTIQTHFSVTKLALVSALFGTVLLNAQIVSPIQSPARPYDLDIVGKVQLAASDDASARFQKEALPDILSLVDKNLGERSNFASASSFNLDPSKLKMAVESTARVYFVGEGAGFRNTLGFNVLSPDEGTPKAGLTDSAQIIFPDASSGYTYMDPKASGKRTSSTPLLPGDFVDLGKFEAGSTLDFFMVADGANRGKEIWTASADRNADRTNHVVAFAMPDSPFLIIAFEDLFGGGDKDYNDLVFAVDIGAINIERLLSTPEPAAWATFGALGMVGFLVRRRMTAADAPAAA